MPYSVPSVSPPVALLFSPTPLCPPSAPMSSTISFPTTTHHQPWIYPKSRAAIDPSLGYIKDSNLSANPLSDVPRSKGMSKIKLSLSSNMEGDDGGLPLASLGAHYAESVEQSGSLAPESNTAHSPVAPDNSQLSIQVNFQSKVKRVWGQRPPTSDPDTAQTALRHDDTHPTETIRRSRGTNILAGISRNSAAHESAVTTSNNGAFSKRSHQAIMAGQGNVLRLNLDAIKRSRAELSSAISCNSSSTAHASKTKFNTIGSSTCSVNLIRKKSGELVKPALRSSSSHRDKTPEREGPLPLPEAISSPVLPTPHAKGHRVGLARRNSAPSTPATKFVHFDAQLEHVKLFLAEQKPAAVSRDGSPHAYSTTEDEWPWDIKNGHIKNKNKFAVKVVEGLPSQPITAQSTLITNPDADVKLESLHLTEDGCSLRGSVVVKNLSFDKWIAVRFTMDWWQTTSEVTAKYSESIVPQPSGQLAATCLSSFATQGSRQQPSHDRFTFTIKLSDVMTRIEEKTMFIAIRYNACGREMWDNNNGRNYQVVFERTKSTPDCPKNDSNTILPPLPPPKSSGWQVKNATTPRDQLADLRKELEKVVNDDGEKSQKRPLLLIERKAKTCTFLCHSNDSSPSLSPAPLQPSIVIPEPPSLTDGPNSLMSRYDFANSVRSTWNPPPLPPLPRNVPLYQRESSQYRPLGWQPPLNGPVIPQGKVAATLPGSVPFPTYSSLPSPEARDDHLSPAPSQGIPIGSNLEAHSSVTAIRRTFGSPRDCGDGFEANVTASHYDQSLPESHGSHTFLPTSEVERGRTENTYGSRRNHRRHGAVSSYFDGWAASQGINLKKTPPGTPHSTVLGESQEVFHDEEGDVCASQDSAIADARAEEETETEAENMANKKAETGLPLTACPSAELGLNAAASTHSPPLRSGSTTPQSGFRFNSFPPIDCSPNRRFFYGLSSAGATLPHRAPEAVVTKTVNSDGIALVGWTPGAKSFSGNHGANHLRPFQPAIDDELSAASTPSITSSSSPSQSPSSPPHSLPMSPPPDLDVSSMLSLHGSARNRPAIDSSHYNFFLDRFCFFTGNVSDGDNSASVSNSSNLGSDTISPRRIHSESEVAEYFNHQAQVHAGGSMYESPPMPYTGFGTFFNANHGMLSSGHTTPTRSPIPDDCCEKGITTPRPCSPVENTSSSPATPVRPATMA